MVQIPFVADVDGFTAPGARARDRLAEIAAQHPPVVCVDFAVSRGCHGVSVAPFRAVGVSPFTGSCATHQCQTRVPSDVVTDWGITPSLSQPVASHVGALSGTFPELR